MRQRRVIAEALDTDLNLDIDVPEAVPTPITETHPVHETKAQTSSSSGFSLFDKFRGASNDFSEWLLPTESVEAKPISVEVADKLKQRLQALSGKSASASSPAPDAPSGSAPLVVSAPAAAAVPEIRAAANSFEDGDFFSFLPSQKSEKEAAQSAIKTENLQAVVTVASSSSSARAAGSSSFIRSSTLDDSVERRVPLWSVERFRQCGGYCESNALVALHEEILDVVDFLSPSQAEVSLRRMIELDITKMAKRLWPGCQPCVYGSLTTHLLLPLSDIDMSILDVPSHVSVEDALTALAREIGNSGLCTTAFPQLILKTKVPLIKFTHKGSLLDVDISVNAGDGKTNSMIVKQYLSEFPEARPLVMVVKYFLQQRDMHEPYHGGLGSFATTLFVISFLQHHPIYTTRPFDRPYTGLGKLLVDFFRYYGCCFNAHRCGISLDNGGFYFLRKQGSAMDSLGRPQTNQVIIEDPGNRSNNAASSLRQFPTIASAFAHAYTALTAVFPLCGDQGSGMSPDSEEIALRPTLLSRILHIDAESVARRKCIIDTFESYRQDASLTAKLAEALQYCAEEDAPMLRRMPFPSATAATPIATTSGGVESREPQTTTSSNRSSKRPSPTSDGAPQFPRNAQEGASQDRRRPRDDDEPTYYDADRQPRPRRTYRSPQF